MVLVMESDGSLTARNPKTVLLETTTTALAKARRPKRSLYLTNLMLPQQQKKYALLPLYRARPSPRRRPFGN
jgi:hypothetical protein